MMHDFLTDVIAMLGAIFMLAMVLLVLGGGRGKK